MLIKTFWSAALLSVLIIPLTRFPTRSHTLYSWDPVQFTLAMDDFELRLHQPHPPGYVLFVYVGKWIRSFVHEPNLSFILWNVLIAVLISLLVFCFAYHASSQEKEKRAWIAWALLLPNVLFWFYTDIAEIYLSELFCTLLVAYCCWRMIQGERRFLYFTAIALAICGGFKLTAMLFVAPLALYSLIQAPVKGKFQAILLFLFSFATWFVPILVKEGAANYFGFVWEIFSATTSTTSPFLTGSIGSFVKNFRDVAYYTGISCGIFNLAAVFLLFIAGKRKLLPPRKHLVFASFWILPYLLFLLFVQIANIGYTLFFVGACSLFLAYYYSRNTRGFLLAGLLAGNVVFSSVHFLALQRFSPEQIGKGLAFGQKSWSQRIAAQADLFLYPIYHTIRTTDRNLEWVGDQIHSLCPHLRNVVLITTDHGLVDWRKAEYYFPDCVSLRLEEQGKNPFMVAQDRKFSVHPETTLEMKQTCKTLWILENPNDVLDQLQRQNVLHLVQEDGRALYWTQEAVRVSLGKGELIIH